MADPTPAPPPATGLWAWLTPPVTHALAVIVTALVTALATYLGLPTPAVQP